MADAFIWGTGRRKAAIARVRMKQGGGQITVNGKPWDEYFTTPSQRLAVRQPLRVADGESRFDVVVTVTGGGPQGQADAVRHGIARALLRAQEGVGPALREAGFLTRDARVKERKKYGQRGARARFQFSKR